MSAIDDKHAQVPWIGNPRDEGAGADEGPLPDGRGRVRDFDNGSIYWAPETGAHEVHGAIRDKWQQMGWERSKLRYPLTDEHDIPGGRASNFQGGEIQWTQQGGPVVRKSGRIDSGASRRAREDSNLRLLPPEAS